jgi:hypothetical protein
MQTTDTKALHDSFVAAIRGITPRYGYLAAQTWHHSPAARETELEGTQLRNFYIRFEAAIPSYLWKGGVGTAYVCRIVVTASYAGIDPANRDHMITADVLDMRRALERLRDPTHAGFVNIEASGVPAVRFDTQANAIIDFPFTVHFHAATAE